MYICFVYPCICLIKSQIYFLFLFFQKMVPEIQKSTRICSEWVIENLQTINSWNKIFYRLHPSCFCSMKPSHSPNIYVKWEISYELRVVSCYFKKINWRIVSYFLRVALLSKWIYEFQFELYELHSCFKSWN